MIKILIGLVAAIVIAAGGFFGFQLYVQHRVAGEVEAAFDQIRATR
jgi:predicted negative regulator of RcsB-dependent stress response